MILMFAGSRGAPVPTAEGGGWRRDVGAGGQPDELLMGAASKVQDAIQLDPRAVARECTSLAFAKKASFFQLQSSLPPARPGDFE